MASIFTHLAIAKRFLEKHPGAIKDVGAFYDGNIQPDLCDDKEKSHYGKRRDDADVLTFHKEKVGVDAFRHQNSIDNDFVRGKLLHLMTDYEFYNNFLDKSLRTVTREEFSKNNIYTSDYYDEYLAGKYGVTIGMTSLEKEFDETNAKWRQKDLERWGTTHPVGKLLFSAQELDGFIERMASVTQ